MPQGVITSIENGFFTVAVPTRDGVISYNVMDDCLPENSSVGAGIDFETEAGLVTKVNILEDEDLEELSVQLMGELYDDPTLLD